MVIPVYDDNPTRRRAIVTWILVAINVVIFLLSPARTPVIGDPTASEVCRQQAFYLRYGAVPWEMTHGEQLDRTVRPLDDQRCLVVTPQYEKNPFLSVITSMFVHGGWLHLIGNMLFLMVFGNNVEDRLGRVRYLLFYLIIGFISAYAFALTRPDSEQPLVGASGAIAGVLGAYLLLFPKAKVTGLITFLFFLPLRMPAWVVLGFWFVLQALYAQGGGLSRASSVAYLVHVIGFALGALYILATGRRYRGPPRGNPTGWHPGGPPYPPQPPPYSSGPPSSGWTPYPPRSPRGWPS